MMSNKKRYCGVFNILNMKHVKILAAISVIVIIVVFSCGCIGESAKQPGSITYTDDEGNTYSGNDGEGSINYADGTVETWYTDSEGNIRHTVKDVDGKVYRYHFTPSGELVYEDIPE